MVLEVNATSGMHINEKGCVVRLTCFHSIVLKRLENSSSPLDLTSCPQDTPEYKMALGLDTHKLQKIRKGDR